MHKDHFTFKPTFKLLFVGNNRPELKNVNAAIRRRVNIVEFKYVPAAPDLRLEETLISEAPGYASLGGQRCA